VKKSTFMVARPRLEMTNDKIDRIGLPPGICHLSLVICHFQEIADFAGTLQAGGAIGSGVKQHGRRDCEKIVFGTNDIQMAVIVFVKFVEFVAAFSGHEFHELTRIEFILHSF